MATTWVKMTHPGLTDEGHKPATVTEVSYTNTWKDLGWKLYKPPKKREES